MKKLLSLFVCVVLPLCAAAQQNWKAVMRYNKQSAKTALSQRLSKYVTYDTTSNADVAKVPSSKGQLAFGKVLAKELKSIGAKNVKISKSGIVTAEIPATTTKPAPTLAFLAHLDTSASSSGKNVVPQIHSKYRGGDIVINQAQNLRLTEYNSPQLLHARGHDIMTASGGTLLGADDKAGIAIIMTFADYLLGNTSIEHGPIKIAFTPDEEISTGIKTIDLTDLNADYAYTVDGGNLGETTVENFNGRSFTAVFNGERGVHAGSAMNSSFADNVLMASDFHTLLPRHRRPETTSGRQGFVFVNSIETKENQSVVKGTIRAFTDEELTDLTEIVKQTFQTVKALNPKNTGTELSFEDQYKNVKEVLPSKVIEILEQAMIKEEVTPKRVSARRETDGIFLSFNGLPTADIFAGMFNPHSQLEYADIDIMEASLRTLLTTTSYWNLETKPQP
ncbi:MAG: peptidase T [Elusimicrobiaceae bacterium]|nr:peptidase T [Elusimicrobiaceae bacterium]